MSWWEPCYPASRALRWQDLICFVSGRKRPWCVCWNAGSSRCSVCLVIFFHWHPSLMTYPTRPAHGGVTRRCSPAAASEIDFKSPLFERRNQECRFNLVTYLTASMCLSRANLSALSTLLAEYMLEMTLSGCGLKLDTNLLMCWCLCGRRLLSVLFFALPVCVFVCLLYLYCEQHFQ